MAAAVAPRACILRTLPVKVHFKLVHIVSLLSTSKLRCIMQLLTESDQNRFRQEVLH